MNRANWVLVLIISILISVLALNLLRSEPTMVTAVTQGADQSTVSASVSDSAGNIVFHSKMIVVESLTMTKVVISSAIDSVISVL